jgi:uncharacterized protein (TIGR03086 family)
MESVSERYRRLSAQFEDKIKKVPDGAWGDATPCTDWTVRDLVSHMIEMSQIHLSLVGQEAHPGPSVDDDPVGAFAVTREQIQSDLEDPERAKVTFKHRLGRWTFAEAIENAVCPDLVVHGWDLARATGQDERIDPQEFPLVWKSIKMVPDNLLRGMACGPEVAVAADADEQTRLLAYYGRKS